MTVRVVLAVAFALALVAAAQPALDHATRTRDGASLRTNADRVTDAVADLRRRSDPGESLAAAPRRTLHLDLPADATLTARTNPPAVVSRLPNGPGHRHALPIRLETCGDEHVLNGRVTLVYVERADGPVVVALRGFIRGDEATASHACTPRPLRNERTGLRV